MLVEKKHGAPHLQVILVIIVYKKRPQVAHMLLTFLDTGGVNAFK